MISLAVRRWHCDRTIFSSQISHPRDRGFFQPDVGFRGYACDIWTGAPGIKNLLAAAVFGGSARGLAFLTTNLSSAFSKQCKSFPKGCEGERE